MRAPEPRVDLARVGLQHIDHGRAADAARCEPTRRPREEQAQHDDGAADQAGSLPSRTSRMFWNHRSSPSRQLLNE